MLSHERAETLAKNFKKAGIEPVLIGPIALFVLFFIIASTDPAAIGAFFTALAALSPVWIPLFFLRYFWILWINYIRYLFWFDQDTVLLEITLPPEVEKSPLAMEVFLSTLWNSGGEPTFIHRMWKGQFRAVWSLEIASNEGRISYYIHMRRVWRNIVESRLYGQFPEAKIAEVTDYASRSEFNLVDYELWGLEYEKGATGALPIKSYIEYELDKDPDKPETTVDPITHILEFFSSIGKDEYLWLQIIVKARKKDEWYGKYLKKDKLKDAAKEEINTMVVHAVERSKQVLEGLKIENEEDTVLRQAAARGAALLSEGERKKVEAIERSLNKLMFECGIRGIYMAKRGNFNGVNNGGLVRLFDPLRAPEHNVLNPTRGLIPFDYPWQDFRGIRKNRARKQLLFHYKHRAYFYVPYDQTPVFLNIEELATLWHFPSSAVQPPGLERVAAKRAEAPVGLPTG